MSDKFHYCPYCNYKWLHGQDGSHSCTDRLVKQRDELLAALIEADEMLGVEGYAIDGPTREPIQEVINKCKVKK